MEQAEVFPHKAALKVKAKMTELKIDKLTLAIAVIFIVSLLVMLGYTIHLVDVYNGTFP